MWLICQNATLLGCMVYSWIMTRKRGIVTSCEQLSDVKDRHYSFLHIKPGSSDDIFKIKAALLNQSPDIPGQPKGNSMCGKHCFSKMGK